MIPTSLHDEIVKELDDLAALEPKHYHPGTDGKVQDLIHPSLYPYIANRTPLHPGVMPPLLNQEGQFETTMESDSYSETFLSTHAWNPSPFKINEDETEMHELNRTYINGLGPRTSFENLYGLIERVFKLCIPVFNRSFSAAPAATELFDSPYMTPSEKRWLDRMDKRDDSETTPEEWKELIEKDHVEYVKGSEERKA